METATRESFSDIINGPVPVLVDFFAEWCGPCKMMPPILKEVHQATGNKARILKIDVDRNPAIAQAFGVRSVPTLILFKKGKTVWRTSGVVPARQLVALIQQHQ